MGLWTNYRVWKDGRVKIRCAHCGKRLGTLANPDGFTRYKVRFCTVACSIFWSKDPKNKDAVIRYYLGDLVTRSYRVQE